MDNLPPAVVIEILRRLDDSAELARCRLVSRIFNTLSYEVRSMNLVCTTSRYLKSRSPMAMPRPTSFKALFINLARNYRMVESISIGVDELLQGLSFQDDGYRNSDLHLTDDDFLRKWLPKFSGELRSLSISNLWVQSCFKRSRFLALVSSCCHGLLKLEVKYSWLAVDQFNPMPRLTTLTLEFVELDDENLTMINQCLPCLQVLSLIGVGPLKEPKIRLLHLQTCRWMVSNAPHSLTISAPNLAKLELKCVKPKSTVIETPLLSDLRLSIHQANDLELKELVHLKTLCLESANICSLIHSFPHGAAIKRLTVDSTKTGSVERTILSLEALFNAFPNLSYLSLRAGAWCEAETHFLASGLQRQTIVAGLKEISAQLVIDDIDLTLLFISIVLDRCTELSEIGLLVHLDDDRTIASGLISRCTALRPQVRWKWGTWKEGVNDAWVSGFD